MKNRLFCDRLREVNCHIKEFNVTGLQRRIKSPILILKLLIETLFHNYRRIIVSTHDSLAFRIINILGKIGIIEKTIYWVIGGGVSKRIERDELSSRFLNRLYKIVVEDNSIKDHLNLMGYLNVITVPNFKPIMTIRDVDKYTNRFVFVSRITPLKGCDIIISAVKELNRKGLLFDMDFYGYIEDGYPFEEYINNIPNVHYRGVLSLKSQLDYEYLSKYTALVLPTFYPNEGFPGTLIDGFIAGLPIITSRWRYNENIIDDMKQGWLLDIQNSEALAEVMEGILKGNYDLLEMSNYCAKKAKEYDIHNVLAETLLSQLSLV